MSKKTYVCTTCKKKFPKSLIAKRGLHYAYCKWCFNVYIEDKLLNAGWLSRAEREP